MVYSAREDENWPLALVTVMGGCVVDESRSESWSLTRKSIPADRTCTHSMEGKARSISGSCMRAVGQEGETNSTLGLTHCSGSLDWLFCGKRLSKSWSVVPVATMQDPKGRLSSRLQLARSSGSERLSILASCTMLSGDILMR